MVTLVFVLKNTFLHKILLERVREFVVSPTCFQKVFEFYQEERRRSRKEPFLCPWLCVTDWPRYKAINPFSHILNRKCWRHTKNTWVCTFQPKGKPRYDYGSSSSTPVGEAEDKQWGWKGKQRGAQPTACSQHDPGEPIFHIQNNIVILDGTSAVSSVTKAVVPS